MSFVSDDPRRGDSGSNTPPANSSKSFRKLGYLPALDGFRALAVLLVLVYHVRLPGFHGGRAGVDIFFVLSGFLITALLLDERAKTGEIGLRAFYMRRILRLYPALIVACALAVSLGALKIVVFDASTRSLDTTLKGLPFVLFYTMNIARAVAWTGGGFLAHTWSLAIEEQFYLVWPIVVILVMRRRSSPGLVGAIALVCALTSASLRAGLDLAGFDKALLFNATYTHVDGIFAGCALGVAWSMRNTIVNRIANPLATIGAFVAAAVVIVRGDSMDTYGFFVIVVATVILVANLLTRPQSAMSSFLSTGAMVEIGRRSYGIYLYHWPIFQFFGTDRRLHSLVLGFGLTFVAAWVSFALVEQPFLRIKKRWTYRAHPDTPFHPPVTAAEESG